MADRVYIHGRIITVDTKYSNPEGVLIRDGRIHTVGTIEELRRAAGSDTSWFDLTGRSLLPGFNDNHIHVIQLGMRHSSPDLAGLDADQIVEKLSAHREANPDEPLLVGYGWDYPSCPNPHRELLDKHFPEESVFLFQFSGHAVWTNTRGLKALGLLRSKKNPPESLLLDDTGSPTGVVRETSINKYIARHFRKRMTDLNMIREGLMKTLPELARVGITSVQDNTWLRKPIRVLRDLQRDGLLTCRFACWPLGEIPFLGRWFSTADFDDDWIRLGPWKQFIDGAFSSRSAWLSDEYADEPGNFGSGRDSGKIFRSLARHAKRSRQAAYHGIGDRAVKEFCDAMERVVQRYPRARNLRYRIEHAQLIRREDLPRLRELGILVCAQPPALIDPEKDRNLLGEKRALEAYPYRSLLDEGVVLSFGSDYPGEVFYEPLRAIHLAVNREGPERIGVEEAVSCYTMGSAYAEGKETDKGSITPGKWADFVVLSDDILAIPASRIEGVTVMQTVVGGETVYQEEALVEVDPARL